MPRSKSPKTKTAGSMDPKKKSSVSAQIFNIAGVTTVVHGLEELSQTCQSISCLWLLHPRLQTREIMAYVASDCINDWNSQPSSQEHGLIAASFDQRNHGSREVDPHGNLTWRKGNERHAIDMFSIFQGTSVDTSLLIDHLGSYIFNKPNDPEINHHLVLGVSLGGHSAWQVLLNDERVTAGVVVIGCPDYARLMSSRAELSGRESAGPEFLGSTDFPKALVKAVHKYDPKGIFFGSQQVTKHPAEGQREALRDTLDQRLKTKQIFLCFGEKDKLVPYDCSEPFLSFLKDATSTWYIDGKLQISDKTYPDTGHEFTEDMLNDSVRFVTNYLLASIKSAAPKLS